MEITLATSSTFTGEHLLNHVNLFAQCIDRVLQVVHFGLRLAQLARGVQNHQSGISFVTFLDQCSWLGLLVLLLFLAMIATS
jgi:hypothetical protein